MEKKTKYQIVLITFKTNFTVYMYVLNQTKNKVITVKICIHYLWKGLIFKK